jgi:hypothetical protein
LTEIGNKYRDYLSDILEELGQEFETENLLLDELKRTANVLIPQLDMQNFNIDDYTFDFANHKGINIVEFYGYKENKQLDSTGNMFKDILQSLAYRNNVIFIDSSKDHRIMLQPTWNRRNFELDVETSAVARYQHWFCQDDFNLAFT